MNAVELAQKPLLKWPGGKHRLTTQLTEAFGDSPCEGYFEPFAGGAALFWHLAARGDLARCERRPMLSDACFSLVAAYLAVRDAPERVRAHVDSLSAIPGEWREAYYDIRDAFNAYRSVHAPRIRAGERALFPTGPDNHVVDHGADMLWLNRACFNGLWRTNRNGAFNASLGSYKIVDVPTLAPWSNTLNQFQVRLECCDWRVAVEQLGPRDRALIDMPYLPLDDQHASWTGYGSAAIWDEEEHDALARALTFAARRGAFIVLTNHDCEATHRIYSDRRGFRVHGTADLSRSISRSADRMVAREAILTLSPDDARPDVRAPVQLALGALTPPLAGVSS